MGESQRSQMIIASGDDHIVRHSDGCMARKTQRKTAGMIRVSSQPKNIDCNIWGVSEIEVIPKWLAIDWENDYQPVDGTGYSIFRQIRMNMGWFLTHNPADL